MSYTKLDLEYPLCSTQSVPYLSPSYSAGYMSEIKLATKLSLAEVAEGQKVTLIL